MVFAKSYSNLDSWTTITVQKTMLCNFQNVSEAAGSVQFRDGKYAEIMVNEKWTPICGPCFWDNDFGASLFYVWRTLPTCMKILSFTFSVPTLSFKLKLQL